MNPTTDYTTIITRVSHRLRRLTGEQKATRIGSTTPSIEELIRLMTNNGKFSLETVLQAPLDDEMAYHLGQLVVVLDMVAMQDRRSMLVRWFE